MPKPWTWAVSAVGAAVWCASACCAAQELPPPWSSGDADPMVPWAPPSSGGAPGDPTRVRRVLLMSLAGVLGGVGGGVGGVLLAEDGARRFGGGGGNLGAIYLGATAGYFTGLSLSVLLAGYAQGGNGGYGWVLLGGLGGTLVVGSLGLATRDPWGMLSFAVAGGVAGSVLAYELSNDAHGRLRRRPAPRVLPTVSADATGLRMGLGGTF